MNRRVQVLGAVWLVVFASQAFEPMVRCLVEVGPVRALGTARTSVIGWSVWSSVVVAIVALVWYVGWPPRQGIDPDEPHPPLPPPPT